MYLYTRGICAEQKSHGFKNLEKLGPACSVPIGSREQCAQKPIGYQEQCAQKQIKPLRGPAAEASLFHTKSSPPPVKSPTVLGPICSLYLLDSESPLL